MRERADQDSDLIEALRRAELNAADLLVDRHRLRIYRLARRVLADPRDAEEVAQDVLVTVVRQIRLFKGAAAFASWIYWITANAAYGRSRRSRRARAEVSLENLPSKERGRGKF